MNPTTHSSANASRRITTAKPGPRVAAAKPAVASAAVPLRQPNTAVNTRIATPKKLSKAAVAATATAFFAGFKALPGAVQWRVVQLIEDYEDGLAEAHDAAEMAANPEVHSRAQNVPWEQVQAEYEANHGIELD